MFIKCVIDLMSRFFYKCFFFIPNTATRLLFKKDYFSVKLHVAPVIEFHDTKAINVLRFLKISRKPIDFIDKRK